MQKSYERIAEGIHITGKVIKPSDIVMPIGFDGAILYHLLTDYYEKYTLDYKDNLGYTVQVSSIDGESDRMKFETILSLAKDAKVYGLDMRTKTGTLGKMLGQMKQEWKGETGNRIEFYYTVIFDPYKHADLRVFEEGLSDEERPLWLPAEDDLRRLFWKEGDMWKYDISHEFIANIPKVQQIKKLI